MLRIEAILRRTGPRTRGRRPHPARPLQLRPRAAASSDRGDAPVRLTEAEAQLLRQLARHAHAPVDRLDLARETAEPPAGRSTSRSPACGARSRPTRKNPRYLQTVRGVGYMLAPDG